MSSQEITMNVTWLLLVLALFLLSLCLPQTRSEFLVNAKTKAGNVVKQSITENISDNSITLEYTDWDLTKITQLVDFKSGFNLFRVVLYGEVDMGQPTVQILCFVSHLISTDFIEPDLVSKLRQKNQDAIRVSENQLESVYSVVDLVVDIDQSQLISPHVKQLCQGSNGAIYTSDNDIRRTATEYVRDYDTMMTATHRLTTRQLTSCNKTSLRQSTCTCHYAVSIDWYPCSLRFCKNSNGASYKCGIKTCGQTRVYEFPVKDISNCWWDR